MGETKYVVIDGSARVFSALESHADVAAGKPVEGAGFVRMYVHPVASGKIVVRCFGKSVSLGIDSRGLEDSECVARTLFGEYWKDCAMVD